MKQVRVVIFWAHLIAGLVGGVIVLVMGVTGAVLAFDPQIEAWSSRPSAPVLAPPGAARLAIGELLGRVERARPGEAPSALVLARDPAQPVRVNLARETGVHVDPYSGVVSPLPGQRWRDVSHFMLR
jgi:uncharacterized iron-regulated membrane protein